MNIEINENVALNVPVKREQKLDAQGRAYATGKRKSSISRVWLKSGTGKIVINGKDQKPIFPHFSNLNHYSIKAGIFKE